MTTVPPPDFAQMQTAVESYIRAHLGAVARKHYPEAVSLNISVYPEHGDWHGNIHVWAPGHHRAGCDGYVYESMNRADRGPVAIGLKDLLDSGQFLAVYPMAVHDVLVVILA